jgi:hypothetical protein
MSGGSTPGTSSDTSTGAKEQSSSPPDSDAAGDMSNRAIKLVAIRQVDCGTKPLISGPRRKCSLTREHIASVLDQSPVPSRLRAISLIQALAGTIRDFIRWTFDRRRLSRPPNRKVLHIMGNDPRNPGQGNPGQGNPGQGNPGQGNPGQGNPSPGQGGQGDR